MGVSALFASTVYEFRRHLPDCAFTVFDNALGVRMERFEIGDAHPTEVRLAGARAGRRYYLPENLAAMAAFSGLGRLGAVLNPNLRLIDACDAVLDVSGGDSFSDIYGRARFMSVVRPKLIAIARHVPLILLPQTYGPYANPRFRQLASFAVRHARMAWARDEHSFRNLRDMLGEAFDPGRHRCGVDLAFSLPPKDASRKLAPDTLQFLEPDGAAPLVGFNVSGLIYNGASSAKVQYGLKADYPEMILAFLTWLLETTNARLLLVPHVHASEHEVESDYAACRSVADRLPGGFGHRVHVLGGEPDQGELKWVISRTDWFCGTRMHSTIAALSSGVATAGVAYSDKMRGVFACCGQDRQVIDPRRLTTAEVVAGLEAAFSRRDAARRELAASLPAVMQQADRQVREILGVLARPAPAGGAGAAARP